MLSQALSGSMPDPNCNGIAGRLADVDTDSLIRLLQFVAAQGYRFTAVTPLTHQRVLAHRPLSGATLRDIFGWNMPFDLQALPSALRTAMNESNILIPCGRLFRSAVRIASLGKDVFLHSAFPTIEDNAIFFGPDTYRFARFIQQALHTEIVLNPAAMGPNHAPYRILDIGCGSGAGGIVAARATAHSKSIELTMNDINPAAIKYTAVNADAAGIPVVLAQGDALSAVDGEFDLIISNPPYIDDAAGRAYRHGGERLGRALSVRIAAEAVNRLAPGGRLLLYTGVAMVDEDDPFHAELLPVLAAAGCDWSYDEIDPDVFGEELERPAYAQAHRIAVVGLIATRRYNA